MHQSSVIQLGVPVPRKTCSIYSKDEKHPIYGLTEQYFLTRVIAFQLRVLLVV
jgi:hypothetical protein